MSKIGRKKIPLGDVSVTIQEQTVSYKGPKGEGQYTLPDYLAVTQEDGAIQLTLRKKFRNDNMLWGMHRALLANNIVGVGEGFKKELKIIGLGYKAIVSGKKVELSLGYSHKIRLELPEKVSLEVDKTGQNLVFRSTDKELLGRVCDQVRSYRPPEPYKGTGVKLKDEVIMRKAGKAKAA